MNHPIIAALCLGNALHAFHGQPPEVAVTAAVIALRQIDSDLSQGDAENFVLAAVAEITNIPFSTIQIQEAAAKMGVTIPVH